MNKFLLAVLTALFYENCILCFDSITDILKPKKLNKWIKRIVTFAFIVLYGFFMSEICTKISAILNISINSFNYILYGWLIGVAYHLALFLIAVILHFIKKKRGKDNG